MSDTRNTAIKVLGTLGSLTGPTGSLLFGGIAKAIFKEKIPEVPYEYATDVRQLSMEDQYRYNVDKARAEHLRQINELRSPMLEQQRMEEMEMLRRQQQLDLNIAQDRIAQSERNTRLSHTTVGEYNRISVSNQVQSSLPSIISQPVQSGPRVTVVSQHESSVIQESAAVDYKKYVPYAITGLLVLSLILTGRSRDK